MHTTTEGQNNDIFYETEHSPQYIWDTSMQNEQSQEIDRAVVSKNKMNEEATLFEWTASNNPPSIGQDVWKSM